VDLLSILWERVTHGDIRSSLLQLLFIITVSVLLSGSFIYHFARLGQLTRKFRHRPLPLNILESIYEKQAPSLAILVPSYKEDLNVITKTLLSASLLDYPGKQVVLLIDNPPNPTDWNEQKLLEKTRELPGKICERLDVPARHFKNAFTAFVNRSTTCTTDIPTELRQLAKLYIEAANWLMKWGAEYPLTNHEDQWFVDEILSVPAKAHRQRAMELDHLAKNDHVQFDIQRLYREYCRLNHLFQIEITCFERKRYINLSHEPNKAMNLNSYLGLMDHYAVEKKLVDGKHLFLCDHGRKGKYFPGADFVITLDADSLLCSDYALKLVAVLQERGNERIAVAQTPYSAFPKASSQIERIAGATTDIQYLVHQGFTHFNATFWVGANAILRKTALEDIVTVEKERGYHITKYIQDRTVIEDTESSVDLIDHGWQLYNYPERLAFSATPPDFGSLLIQRRRWANGGLIILPKFLRFIWNRNQNPNRILHGCLGGFYLTSLAGANMGIVILLLCPFEETMRTPWLPLAIVPYFMLYARDLMQNGYRASDVLRVSALNLLLVPVSLGGVFKSLQQIVSGQKAPFGRTPKVSNRIATPLLYLLAVYGFMGYCLISLVMDIEAARWMHAMFVSVNAGILLYAITRFIGIQESIEDGTMALRQLMRKNIIFNPSRRALRKALSNLS